MKSNFTQAEAIPGLMGGTANKDSERYKRRGGLHTPNAKISGGETTIEFTKHLCSRPLDLDVGLSRCAADSNPL
jgi:hypothetical protein